MVQINIAYVGKLHCRAEHAPSGATLETDAPKDNQGLGETFSPTDLLATALGTCMMTILAISAKKHAIELEGSRVTVTKEMSSAPPRRVERLGVTLQLPAEVPPEHRPALEAAAHACPVHRALHPDVKVPLVFQYV